MDRARLKVGFIGLGNMGAPMAVNLTHGGFDMVVYDVRPDAVIALEAEGARGASSIAALADRGRCRVYVRALRRASARDLPR